MAKSGSGLGGASRSVPDVPIGSRTPTLDSIALHKGISVSKQSSSYYYYKSFQHKVIQYNYSLVILIGLI